MSNQDYVVEHAGRYYVARYSPERAQYEGPLRTETKKASGCFGFICRASAGLPTAGGYSYARRSDALRRARKVYEGD